MILLEDDLPEPLSIGQVVALKLLARQENLLVPDYQTELFFKPCHL